MKKVMSRAMICVFLLLAVFLTACKNLSNNEDNSGGGKNKPKPSYIIDPDNPPLTLEAINAGEISFTNPSKVISLKYKINDEDIIYVTDTTSIQVSTGDKVYLFADGNYICFNDGIDFTIQCTSDCYVYGNVMSLLTADYKTATTITKNDAFANLFNGNTHIKNHSTKKIVLPATTLTQDCYYRMFAGCTSLTEAPELPATTLARWCYDEMFIDCSSLTKAPDLPATTLTEGCYRGMFHGCKKLSKAPVLPATTVKFYSYYDMFSDCSSLDRVECFATNISEQHSTDYWLSGVASTGTFIKASAMNDWTRDENGIPSGWAVIDYDSILVPLTFQAVATGEITFDNLDRISNLKYTKNNGPLTDVNSSISVAANDIVSLFANGTTNDEYEHGTTFKINCTSTCYIYGNVMSLLTDDYQHASTITQDFALNQLFYNNKNIKNHPSKELVLPATTLSTGCYYYMFYGCTSLTKAPVLPATNLAENCYAYMFKSCTSLTKTPVLPAKTMKMGCYGHMFDSCTSLTEPPELPAKSLAANCYWCIFVDCSSLTKAPELPATELQPWCYCDMFYNCKKLTEAPELPSTIMKDHCYWGMFLYCTSLKKAPSLPATNLDYDCYGSMFEGCTSLTDAPDLPASSLKSSCYNEMFEGCTSLTTAPVLSASILASGCYEKMFSGCSSLKKVECLATDISAENCTTNWLSGVASTGTFIKASGMNNWTRDKSGIPSGWTVQ